jgi:hypothetical protein
MATYTLGTIYSTEYTTVTANFNQGDGIYTFTGIYGPSGTNTFNIGFAIVGPSDYRASAVFTSSVLKDYWNTGDYTPGLVFSANISTTEAQAGSSSGLTNYEGIYSTYSGFDRSVLQISSSLAPGNYWLTVVPRGIGLGEVNAHFKWTIDVSGLDGEPIVSVSDSTFTENDDPIRAASLTIEASGAATEPYDITVTVPADAPISLGLFGARTTTVTMPAYTKSVVVPFLYPGDDKPGRDATYTVSISSKYGNDTATMTLVDDDLVELAITPGASGPLVITEGKDAGAITVTAKEAADYPVEITFSLTDPAALAELELLNGGKILLPAGQKSVTANIVKAIEDKPVELTDVALLKFSANAVGVDKSVILTASSTEGVVHIKDAATAGLDSRLDLASYNYITSSRDGLLDLIKLIHVSKDTVKSVDLLKKMLGPMAAGVNGAAALAELQQDLAAGSTPEADYNAYKKFFVNVMDQGVGNLFAAGGAGAVAALTAAAPLTGGASLLAGVAVGLTVNVIYSELISSHIKEQMALLFAEAFPFSAYKALEAPSAPLFDLNFYTNVNGDVVAAGVDPLIHFQNWGWQEGRSPNYFFGTTDYLNANRDVQAANINPFDHYNHFGWHEGRDPGFSFDTNAYLAKNPDVKAAGMNPLEHYLAFGKAEGRQIEVAVFDAHPVNGIDQGFYLAANPDVAKSGMSASEHYAQYGWKESRNPNAYFDTARYLAQNEDVAVANIDPLEHYMTWGWKEGREASARFDTNAYLAANPDVAAAGVNPLEHWLNYGINEGRSTGATELLG